MNKRTNITSIGCAIMLLTLMPAGAAHANGAHHCAKAPVQTFWENSITGNELSGRAILCGTPWSLLSRMKVRGLSPGNAYTVWWTYIDDPKSCQNFFLTTENAPFPIPADEPVGYAGSCGIADFGGPNPDDPLGVFGRMDGVVPHRDGNVYFSGSMRSFVPSSGSQVWLWIFGHGPVNKSDNKHRARQLLTPEDPNAGAPHLGNIVDGTRGYPAGVVVFDIP